MTATDDDPSRRFLLSDLWRGRQPKATLAGASLTDPAAGARRTAQETETDE